MTQTSNNDDFLLRCEGPFPFLDIQPNVPITTTKIVDELLHIGCFILPAYVFWTACKNASSSRRLTIMISGVVSCVNAFVCPATGCLLYAPFQESSILFTSAYSIYEVLCCLVPALWLCATFISPSKNDTDASHSSIVLASKSSSKTTSNAISTSRATRPQQPQPIIPSSTNGRVYNFGNVDIGTCTGPIIKAGGAVSWTQHTIHAAVPYRSGGNNNNNNGSGLKRIYTSDGHAH